MGNVQCRHFKKNKKYTIRESLSNTSWLKFRPVKDEYKKRTKEETIAVAERSDKQTIICRLINI